jgi:hypothetical protein
LFEGSPPEPQSPGERVVGREIARAAKYRVFSTAERLTTESSGEDARATDPCVETALGHGEQRRLDPRSRMWGNGRFEETQVKRILPAAFEVVSVMLLAACGGSMGSASSDGALGIQDLVLGTGATAATNDVVTVNYVGALTNGTKFDSSYDRNQPFTFRLGAGAVIAGWDQGVVGMRVGGKRRLTIPPTLGYGSQVNGPIPANSTLVFEIELLSIAGK